MDYVKGVGNTALAATDALGSAIVNIPAKVLSGFQGAGGASVADPGWADKVIKWTEERNKRIGAEHAETGDVIPGFMSNKDVFDAGANAAYSVGAAAGAIYGGVVGSPVPVVGQVGGALAGSALAAYRMDGYQFMQNLLEAKNQESIEKGLGPITKEQEDRLKKELEGIVKKHALWEAGPESAGTVLELALATVKNIPGVRWMPKGMIGKAVKGSLRAMGVLGLEAGTETETQIGQTNAEIQAGLSKESPRKFLSVDDQIKSLKEVLPQVLLLTGGMTVGGKIYRGKDLEEDKSGNKYDSRIMTKEETDQATLDRIRADLASGNLTVEEAHIIKNSAPKMYDRINAIIADHVKNQIEIKLKNEPIELTDVRKALPVPYDQPIDLTTIHMKPISVPPRQADWNMGTGQEQIQEFNEPAMVQQNRVQRFLPPPEPGLLGPPPTDQGPQGPNQWGPVRGDGFTMTQTRDTGKDKSSQWAVDIQDEDLKNGLEFQLGNLLSAQGPGKVQTEGGDFIGWKSGNPEWFKEQGITKEKAAEAIRKAIDGKPLGMAEARIVEGALQNGKEGVQKGQGRQEGEVKGKEPWEMTQREWNSSNEVEAPNQNDIKQIGGPLLDRETQKWVSEKGIDKEGKLYFRDINDDKQPTSKWFSLEKTGRKMLEKTA